MARPVRLSRFLLCCVTAHKASRMSKASPSAEHRPGMTSRPTLSPVSYTHLVSKGMVKSIYALGAKLGMVERGGNHEDALHILVQGLTGKENITALTPAEAQALSLIHI